MTPWLRILCGALLLAVVGPMVPLSLLAVVLAMAPGGGDGRLFFMSAFGATFVAAFMALSRVAPAALAPRRIATPNRARLLVGAAFSALGAVLLVAGWVGQSSATLELSPIVLVLGFVFCSIALPKATAKS